MDIFTKKIMENCDKFSDTIINGFAKGQIDDVVEFLDGALQFAQSSVRDDKFSYVGYKILTPEEEFETEIKTRDGNPKSGRIDTDTTISDVRRIKLTFDYGGRPFWIDIYLPIVGTDGTMTISDTKYVLMPVLTDKIISAHKDHIFLKLYKHKIRFYSTPYLYTMLRPDKDEPILERMLIPYGQKLYGIKDIRDPHRFGVDTPIAIYLLAKYTLSGVNKRYGTNVRIIKNGDIEKYRKDGFVIYSSTGKQLRDMKMIVVDRHEYSIAMSTTCAFSKHLATAILFAFDAIPSITFQYEDSLIYWKYTLGQMIFKLNISADGLPVAIREHIHSLDTYVDDSNRIELSEMGYSINKDFNFYDLIHLILSEHDKLTVIGMSGSASVLDKSLNVLYYVMYDIISSFNKLFSDINNNIQKAVVEGRIFKYEDILALMKNNIVRTRAIFSISKGSSSILSLMLANTSGDNKILKITCLAEIQSRGMGVKRSSNGGGKLPMDVAILKGTDIVYGSLLGLPKSFVTPLARLNCFANFNKMGRLIIPDDLKDFVDEIDADLKNIAIKEDIGDLSDIVIEDDISL